MITSNVSNVIDGIIRDVLGKYGERVSKIILYGSQAKGNIHAESDIDLLVLFEKEYQTISDILFSGDLYDKYLETNGEKVHLIFEKEQFYNLGCEDFYREVPDYGKIMYMQTK